MVGLEGTLWNYILLRLHLSLYFSLPKLHIQVSGISQLGAGKPKGKLMSVAGRSIVIPRVLLVGNPKGRVGSRKRRKAMGAFMKRK